MKGNKGSIATCNFVISFEKFEFSETPEETFEILSDYIIKFYPDKLDKSIESYSIAGRIDLSEFQN